MQNCTHCGKGKIASKYGAEMLHFPSDNNFPYADEFCIRITPKHCEHNFEVLFQGQWISLDTCSECGAYK